LNIKGLTTNQAIILSKLIQLEKVYKTNLNPTKGWLAGKCNCNLSTVKTAFDKLRGLKLIYTHDRIISLGRGKIITSQYVTLNWKTLNLHQKEYFKSGDFSPVELDKKGLKSDGNLLNISPLNEVIVGEELHHECPTGNKELQAKTDEFIVGEKFPHLIDNKESIKENEDFFGDKEELKLVDNPGVSPKRFTGVLNQPEDKEGHDSNKVKLRHPQLGERSEQPNCKGNLVYPISTLAEFSKPAKIINKDDTSHHFNKKEPANESLVIEGGTVLENNIRQIDTFQVDSVFDNMDTLLLEEVTESRTSPSTLAELDDVRIELAFIIDDYGQPAFYNISDPKNPMPETKPTLGFSAYKFKIINLCNNFREVHRFYNKKLTGSYD